MTNNLPTVRKSDEMHYEIRGGFRNVYNGIPFIRGPDYGLEKVLQAVTIHGGEITNRRFMFGIMFGTDTTSKVTVPNINTASCGCGYDSLLWGVMGGTLTFVLDTYGHVRGIKFERDGLVTVTTFSGQSRTTYSIYQNNPLSDEPGMQGSSLSIKRCPQDGSLDDLAIIYNPGAYVEEGIKVWYSPRSEEGVIKRYDSFADVYFSSFGRLMPMGIDPKKGLAKTPFNAYRGGKTRRFPFNYGRDRYDLSERVGNLALLGEIPIAFFPEWSERIGLVRHLDDDVGLVTLETRRGVRSGRRSGRLQEIIEATFPKTLTPKEVEDYRRRIQTEVGWLNIKPPISVKSTFWNIFE